MYVCMYDVCFHFFFNLIFIFVAGAYQDQVGIYVLYVVMCTYLVIES